MELEVIKWLVFSVFGVVGWFMRNTIVQQQEEIKAIKQELDKKLPKDDFKEFKVELREMFNEIKTDIRELKTNHG